MAGATWTDVLISDVCSVRVRYFRNHDRRKDVDNILKAILDGLDGKIGIPKPPLMRVLLDDRNVEQVVSQRTSLRFGVEIDGAAFTHEEYRALQAAKTHQAAVFVSVGPAPDHDLSVSA